MNWRNPGVYPETFRYKHDSSGAHRYSIFYYNEHPSMKAMISHQVSHSNGSRIDEVVQRNLLFRYAIYPLCRISYRRLNGTPTAAVRVSFRYVFFSLNVLNAIDCRLDFRFYCIKTRSVHRYRFLFCKSSRWRSVTRISDQGLACWVR